MQSVTVVALHGDGDVAGVYEVMYIPMGGVSWRTAIARAAAVFLETDEGQEVLKETAGYFNFGDVTVYLPDRYLVAQGILAITRISGAEVIQHDMQFPADA